MKAIHLAAGAIHTVSIGFLNLLASLAKNPIQPKECGYFFALRPAAAAKGATANHRVIVINIAMG